MTATPPGLRERAKARRRAQIQRAAIALFAEAGFDETTVAQIADAAQVSPRTVFGHFDTKLDIALSIGEEVSLLLLELFRARPGEGFVDTLDVWLRLVETHMDLDLARLATAMLVRNPGLRAMSTARISEVTAVGRVALAADLGRPVDDLAVQYCQAALNPPVAVYLGSLPEVGVSEQGHLAFVAFLRGVVDAARA